MILQLHGYPIVKNGQEIAAHEQDELRGTAFLLRSILLAESDWTQVADSPLSPEVRQEWVVFRQYLRDLPSMLPEVMEDTLEIMDPPTVGCPTSWVNVTPNAIWLDSPDGGHTH